MVSGRAWVMVTRPPVIAAATRNVPASMRSATTEMLAGVQALHAFDLDSSGAGAGDLRAHRD